MASISQQPIYLSLRASWWQVLFRVVDLAFRVSVCAFVWASAGALSLAVAVFLELAVFAVISWWNLAWHLRPVLAMPLDTRLGGKKGRAYAHAYRHAANLCMVGAASAPLPDVFRLWIALLVADACFAASPPAA